MIEQMGQVLIQLRKLILGQAASGGEIEAKLEKAALQSGLELELARRASPETLAILVSSGSEVEPGRCWLMAETLYLDGLHAHLEERPEEASGSLERARVLYGLIRPYGGLLVGLPEAAERIEEIDGLLAEIDGPPTELDREA